MEEKTIDRDLGDKLGFFRRSAAKPPGDRYLQNGDVLHARPEQDRTVGDDKQAGSGMSALPSEADMLIAGINVC